LAAESDEGTGAKQELKEKEKESRTELIAESRASPFAEPIE
jgi:hypothetical protein